MKGVFMNRLRGVAVVVCVVFTCVFGAPVWPPDVISLKKHTLARQMLASGDRFEVIQYWNQCDFYNTELLHTRPDGLVRTMMLDSDDIKTWYVPLQIDEGRRTATLKLRFGRVKTLNW